ncbi:hypothetical protein AGLY_006991 [Aphis glycines]|uniref:Uncharacterized protein n=1 Tax=Aphis glycines TaxID=307491 RepID=A0A6G0TQ80_APHGL|nr:hypothetical protein AGLY_006991 [Aphis glycines]
MEVNNEVKFIIFEKGKPLALLNLYKYRLIRTRKDGLKKWLCIQKSCYCSIVTNGNLLHETTNEHNHSENSVQSIERQVLRENCKRKAKIEHRDIRSIRKAMYDKRRQIYPAFPKSLIESIEQLKSMDNNDVLKFKDDQFVFVPDNKLFLYRINCLRNGFYIPVAYFFLPEKSKSTYIDMWLYLQDLCEKLIFKKLVVRKIHLDFEISAHGACREVFPSIEIQACRFHLGQCWWRKINSVQQLRTAYTNDDELGKWLKLFFELPFLPPHEIENAFVELVSICPNIDIGCLFSDYLLNTYVEDDCLFPPKIWAQEPSENPRTKNGSESFHRTYNAQFHNPHPSIYLVISVLKETQEEICTKIISASKGRFNKMALADKQRLDHTINEYKKYLIHKSIIKYLLSICNKYQGIKL